MALRETNCPQKLPNGRHQNLTTEQNIDLCMEKFVLNVKVLHKDLIICFTVNF